MEHGDASTLTSWMMMKTKMSSRLTVGASGGGTVSKQNARHCNFLTAATSNRVIDTCLFERWFGSWFLFFRILESCEFNSGVQADAA